MKTITGGMRAHLDETVTRLCTLWKITRTDGREFFFTDHDQDIIFGPNNDLHLASVGYQRTATANSDQLAVANMDIEGIFDPDALDQAEMRAGLFDYAEVEISFVDWADASIDKIKVRRGRMGEVVWTPQGVFRSELRGLSQNLSQNLLKVYQPECRADLGDEDCQIPILPPVITRNLAVVLGDFYRVQTIAGGQISHINVGTNMGFETDGVQTPLVTLTGWTIDSGGWRLVGTIGGLAPDEGSQFLAGGAAPPNGPNEINQVIDLLTATSISSANIDGGQVTCSFSCSRGQFFGDDLGRVVVEFLDASDVILATPMDTGQEEITPVDTWATRSFSTIGLPVNTRKVKIRLLVQLGGGVNIDSCFDNLNLSFLEGAEATIRQDSYENRVYQVTTAGTTAASQPTYNTGVGGTTVDGTAVLTSVNSFTRHCTIDSITDARSFVIVVDESRDANGWFTFGGFKFESGQNAGVTVEIKDWVRSTSTVTLYITPPFPVIAGTVGFLFAGCNKSLDQCITKFSNVVNYQGEPFIPGTDKVLSNPAATNRQGI